MTEFEGSNRKCVGAVYPHILKLSLYLILNLPAESSYFLDGVPN